jgi:prevent-host-death family protein
MKQGRRSRRSATQPASNRWPAQEAKARFSELIRRAREEGPQIITVHGREVATVSAFDPKARLAGEGETGAKLVEIMQAMPFKDEVDIFRVREDAPFRDVEL